MCVCVCAADYICLSGGGGMGRSVCMALQFVNSRILCTDTDVHVWMVVTVSVWMSDCAVCVQVCTCLISLWDSECVCVGGH